MTESNQIEYFYNDDSENLINFIFKKGVNNLLCVSLNPKETDEQKEITENIEKLCLHNGFDGFAIIFLNPTITNEIISLEKSRQDINDNYLMIGALLLGDEFKFKKTLVCWGEEIESYNQTFLKESAFIVINDLEKENLDFVCIGTDSSGNPLSINENNFKNNLKKFNFKDYNANIKRTVKLTPEITINGIEFK